MYAPGDVRVEERDEPQIVEATDAIIRVSAACVCGSDLWRYFDRIAARITGSQPPPEAAKPIHEVVTVGPPIGGEE
jgi:threonine dehydrogenase-like Zn-dependent dehydrogenase